MTWPTVKLGEVLTERRERVGTADADGLPLLGVSNVGGLHRSGLERIPDMGRYFRVQKDWFAYNPMRINVGSVGWAARDDQTGVISPDYVVFSCTDRVLAPLVFWFLKHRRGLAAINGETAGSVRERLYFEALSRIDFPLPPMAEQRRLVARIDALAAKIDEAKRLSREAVRESLALMNAVRRRLIGAEPATDWIKLGNVVERIENGWSPACEARPVEGDEWGVLKVGAVSFGIFNPRENKALPPGLVPKQEYEVQPGDFLMSRANTYELVGACAVVQQTPHCLMLSDKLFRFRFRRDVRLDTAYLDHVLKSPALRDQIVRGATGTSPTMKNISKDKVLALRIPNLDIAAQQSLVKTLDGVNRLNGEANQNHRTVTAELDAMLPAILDWAFRGEL